MTHEEEEELRKAIQDARRYEIVNEGLGSFLSKRREEIIKNFEEDNYCEADIIKKLAELRVLREFKDFCKTKIEAGEIAKERMQEIGEY